jgi:hypothetical protein
MEQGRDGCIGYARVVAHLQPSHSKRPNLTHVTMPMQYVSIISRSAGEHPHLPSTDGYGPSSIVKRRHRARSS